MAESDMRPALGSPGTSVVVTGGASGIGLATAEALAAVGRKVALWDINQAKAETAAERIRADYGVATLAVGVDLRDLQALGPALTLTRRALAPLGGLVHSAGIVDSSGLAGVTPESWDAGINTHLRPLVLLVQAMLEDFRANPGSAVVAISSINATLGNAMNPVYTAAKGGMLSLVRSLADTLATDKVRINSVSPGMVRTPMMQPAMDHLPKGYFERRILMERIGEPAEIGRVVRFLLSDEASYITSAEFIVDGGNVSSQRQ
jgi:NAD(P)-dependent dehydrogenase (short-subunit alcohol dehydrogenase family)